MEGKVEGNIKLISIRMKETKVGSPDGMHSYLYSKGETYDIPERLAKIFIEQLKVAEHYTKPKPDKHSKEEYDTDLNLGLGKKEATKGYQKKIMGNEEKDKK